jgi:hypothetical protein
MISADDVVYGVPFVDALSHGGQQHVDALEYRPAEPRRVVEELPEGAAHRCPADVVPAHLDVALVQPVERIFRPAPAVEGVFVGGRTGVVPAERLHVVLEDHFVEVLCNDLPVAQRVLVPAGRRDLGDLVFADAHRASTQSAAEAEGMALHAYRHLCARNGVPARIDHPDGQVGFPDALHSLRRRCAPGRVEGMSCIGHARKSGQLPGVPVVEK